jgi:hypothetical protein
MIRYPCPVCHSLLESPDEFAGASLACPTCRGSLVVPTSSSVKPDVPDSTTIRLVCPNCHSVLNAPSSRAGRKARCPTCKQRLQVPTPPQNKTLVANIAPPPVGASPAATPVNLNPDAALSAPSLADPSVPARGPRGSYATALVWFAFLLAMFGVGIDIFTPHSANWFFGIALVSFLAGCSLRVAGFR